jgi:undecaprenyl diphosphate synthase
MVAMPRAHLQNSHVQGTLSELPCLEQPFRLAVSREELLAWIPAGHPDEMLVRQVNFDRLPAHIAIIMDGNGRWAAQRHLPRVEGHRAGIDAVRDTVETAARLGIRVLTLYAFSIENWKRPAAEISTLMMLLKRYLRSELKTLLTNDIRFSVIGRMEELSDDIQDELRGAIKRTANDSGMLFNIALNYGGRAEIVDAARRAIESGIRPEDLDEQQFESFLYTAGQPDPDLLIRTSGEMRVSNYLLWQIAYAEIYVTETLWPDFRRRHLLEAVLAYQKRDRRYGGISASQAATRLRSGQAHAK